MRYPISWLRQFVNPSCSDAKLIDCLTMAGLEVEAEESYGIDSELIVVAEVISIAPHPAADRLKVCQVRATADESEPLLNIVCGAPNVTEGLKVPLAKVGAVLQGTTISKAKLRGVESFGMLCSADELALGELSADKNRGILVLPNDLPVGSPLNSVLPSYDKLLTIKLTPNRGDCLSILGLAREVAALTQSTLIPPNIANIPVEHDDYLAINLQAGNLCPRYAGRVINNLDANAETPLWMKMRLLQAGERCINVLADITNFVMLELGQPMHAFDRRKLRGPIGVRLAKADETCTLLSDQNINVKSTDLVITDNEIAVALGGVMGGKDTAIELSNHQQNAEVFFEAAHFIPSVVQGRTKHYALSSQAAYRFERGVDKKLPEMALDRATELTIDIMGGAAGALIIEEIKAENENHPPKIIFRLERLRQLIGYPYTASEATTALKSLGFLLEKSTQESAGHHTNEHYMVQAPSWRFDIGIEEDLIEEVARMVGYDKVLESLPATKITMHSTVEAGSQPKRSHWDIAIMLANIGYSETQHYGFIAKDVDQRFSAKAEHYRPISLANPIAENLNVMRSSLIGSLVENCARESRNQAHELRIFEIARVFQWVEDDSSININPTDAHLFASAIHRQGGYYHQPYQVAMLAWGLAEPSQWGVGKQMVDFFDMKGDLETLIGSSIHSDLSLPVIDMRWQLAAQKSETKPEGMNPHPALHPSRSAPLIFQGKHVGWIGELHPLVSRHYHLSSAPIVMECDADAIFTKLFTAYHPISRLPMVERDISILLPNSLAIGAVVDDLEQANIMLLHHVTVFDVYDEPPLMIGYKSVALRFCLQSPDKTLTKEDINAAIATISNRLSSKWQAKIFDIEKKEWVNEK